MKKTALAAAALPEDTVEEILVRVDDVAALFRCTTVCKPWRTLVARPSFLRRRWPEGSPESCSLFGFFAPQEQKHGGKQIFIPTPRSPLDRRPLHSFFAEGADWCEHAEPIASRRGLLLVLLNRPVSTSIIRLAVCNPLAGTCDVLPPLKCDIRDFDREGCGILTGADLSPEGQQKPLPGFSTFFKVLVCLHRDVRGDNSRRISFGYDLLMFSSNESSWTEPRECFNQLHTKRLKMLGCAVVCRGMAHWLLQSRSDYYILQLSADTGDVSFTKLSIQLDTFQAGWLVVCADGTLSFFGPSRLEEQIEIWTPRDADSTAHWLRTRIIKMQVPDEDENNDGDQSIAVCGIGERSGKLLLVDQGVHLADLKTGAAQDVSTQFSGLDSEESVPFEVDWTDFFSSRLGGQK